MDILIQNLTKIYEGKIALDHMCTVIKEGDISALMAPSGYGKTTLLRIMAGFEQADSGSIDGMDGKRISMVFQEDRLCENLSAVSNIQMVCSKEISKYQIIKELEKVGMSESCHQPARELSGGMRRRIALVRALMAPFDILLMDEPFQGLDEENKINVMKYVLQETRGKTVLFVTHEEEESRFMLSTVLKPV